MKSIDYLSIFLLLASAPGWQPVLDEFAPGLGMALLGLLILTGVNLVRGECQSVACMQKRSRPSKMPKRCLTCANPCFEW